jgi:serine acetyltransferase
LGDRSIVAAGATVVGDVPPDTVVGGCPAVVIKVLSDTGINRTSADLPEIEQNPVTSAPFSTEVCR